MHKVLVFGYDLTIGIKLGTNSVKMICKGRDIKFSMCRPCGRIKISSWRQMDRVQTPRGLMRLNGCPCPFDGVPFDVSCFLIFSLGLWLFNLVVLHPMNRDEGVINLGP